MIVTTHHAAKSFKKKEVLRDVELQLEEHRIYGLVGRNGTGKSTLLSLLAGQAPYDGDITVFGQDPFDNQAVMDDIVFTGVDTPYPTNWSFKAILDVASKRYPYWDQATADHLLGTFDLDVKTSHGKASRGQRSMLAIVIALAARAPLTLLDEPYLGLDVQNRDLFYRELVAAQEANPRTIVIASHDLEASAKLVDCYLVLRDGVIRTLESERLDDALVSLTVAKPVPPELSDAALATESLGSSTRVVVRRGVADGSPVALEDAVALAMGGSDV